MNSASPTPGGSRTVSGIEVLSVFLNSTLVGSISRIPGGGDRTSLPLTRITYAMQSAPP